MSLVTLRELEAEAAKLNANSEDGPVVYLDDREDIIGGYGADTWARLLAWRIETALELRPVPREVIAARAARRMARVA